MHRVEKQVLVRGRRRSASRIQIAIVEVDPPESHLLAWQLSFHLENDALVRRDVGDQPVWPNDSVIRPMRAEGRVWRGLELDDDFRSLARETLARKMAGITLRFVRSPDAPKMTIVRGSIDVSVSTRCPDRSPVETTGSGRWSAGTGTPHLP